MANLWSCLEYKYHPVGENAKDSILKRQVGVNHFERNNADRHHREYVFYNLGFLLLLTPQTTSSDNRNSGY